MKLLFNQRPSVAQQSYKKVNSSRDYYNTQKLNADNEYPHAKPGHYKIPRRFHSNRKLKPAEDIYKRRVRDGSVDSYGNKKVNPFKPGKSVKSNLNDELHVMHKLLEKEKVTMEKRMKSLEVTATTERHLVDSPFLQPMKRKGSHSSIKSNEAKSTGYTPTYALPPIIKNKAPTSLTATISRKNSKVSHIFGIQLLVVLTIFYL